MVSVGRAFGAVLLGFLLALCRDGIARADDCHPLTLLASVDLIPAANKRAEFVPVTINGVPKQMLLDTGGGISEISGKAAADLGLGREHLSVRSYDVEGNYSDEAADVEKFGLGNFTATAIKLVIAPQAALFGGSSERIGIIGPDILSSYDVSIDFGSDKLALLSPDHCEGKVIFWQADAVAVVPIEVGGVGSRTSEYGHIFVPVTLDGHKLTALLDTGASTSTLSLPVAESVLGLKPGSPETPYVRDMPGKPGASVYHHRFGSLSLEGIAVDNLDMRIIPDFVSGQMQSAPDLGSRLPSGNGYKPHDMLLGMDVLRHLHIYIAYKEKKLYVTPAGAPSPSAPPPATH
jgi:hypothetical protein